MMAILKRGVCALAIATVALNTASAQQAELATETTDIDALVAAAKAEGQLTTIALPRDWCNYGAALDGFAAKYGITINELNPNASSGDELEAIRANRGNTGPQAPDVIDVGLSFGPTAKTEGLITPYRVQTWNEIPEDAKDSEGFWYGDYYGVLSFQVNTDLVETVPADWADLLSDEYANSIALSGDPRTSNQAIQSVYAAGLSRAPEGSPTEVGEAGLAFFKELNEAGNFVPVVGSTATLAQGTTPILIHWDYNALASRDTLADNPRTEVVVPSSGVLAGVYVQAISAFAPHPNAARLWMEYLYSDEGQLHWLEGYCHPIRFNAMSAAGKIPQEMLDALPPAAAYEAATFPSLDAQNASNPVITQNWDQVVGANIQ